MDLLIVFLIGLGASFFGSFMSGGLAMLTLTALISYGIPPHVALGTLAVGVFGFNIGGLTHYAKNKLIVWDLFWPLTIIGTVGSLAGSMWVVGIDEELLSKAIGYAILVFIPLSLINKKLGIVENKVTKKQKFIGYFNFIFISFHGASIGIGYGLFAVYNLMYFHGLSLLKAKASGKLPGMIGSIGGITVFGYSGIINWSYAPLMFLGMIIGSSIGTYFAIRIGNDWLRYILLLTVGLLAGKLIFGF